MRTEIITESKTTPLPLEREEAAALASLGRSLASRAERPGFETDEDSGDRSVIRCHHTDKEGWYNVRVSEAVGVIAVLGRLQIEIQPKIPLPHLLHLMTAAHGLPRLDEQEAEVDLSDNLLELMARWYVFAAEKLLRRGLIKDYSPRQDFLPSKRGRVGALRTGRAFYSGRIGLDCEFDEFDTDIPLNRIVREGASVVLRNPSLTRSVRSQAVRIRSRMDGVSPMHFGDLRSRPDRRSGHYDPALPLARQLIRAEGRSLRSGARDTWSFLVRTPEMVEAGLRQILADGLGSRWPVRKGHTVARGANVSFNPDLEFARGMAVGDVKYKLQGPDWNRGDLNQIVTFAAAYDCLDGAVFSFRSVGRHPLPSLQIGKQRIRSITWPIREGLSPHEAADVVLRAAETWLAPIAMTAAVARSGDHV